MMLTEVYGVGLEPNLNSASIEQEGEEFDSVCNHLLAEWRFGQTSQLKMVRSEQSYTLLAEELRS